MSRQANIVKIHPGRNRNLNPGPSYVAERKRIYPSTWSNSHPSTEAERDYREYTTLTQVANTSRNTYERERAPAWRESRSGEHEKWDSKIAFKGREIDVTEEERYYLKSSQGLHPTQHTVLIEPAKTAHQTMDRMTGARREFIDTHPYAYRNEIVKRQHVGLASSAAREAEQYRVYHEEHVQYAATEARGNKDKYGRLRPVCYERGSSPTLGHSRYDPED